MAAVVDKSAVAAEVAAAVGLVRERWEALAQQGAQIATVLANRLIESSYTGDPSNWAGLEANTDLRGLVAAKMNDARDSLVANLEQKIRELKVQYDELKRVAYRLETACDMLSQSDRQSHSELSFRFKVSTLVDTEILLKELVTSLGQDLKCKIDVCQGLRQLSLTPESFNAATHDHLTLYLAIWTEAPLADMRNFRLAEIALLAEI